MNNKRKNHKTRHTHIHLWDLPKRYFPRNSQAKIYRSDLLRLVQGLNYTNKLIQYSARIAIFNIRSIYQKNYPTPEPEEVFGKIEEFVYHYENYCYRAFSLREKVIQFLNAILPIGYREKEVKIENIVINPIIQQAKILSLVEKFSKPVGALYKLIADRHQLTHRIYYGDKFDQYLRPNQNVNPASFRSWLKDWGKEILKRASQSSRAEYEISEICNHLAERVKNYKDSINSARPRHFKRASGRTS